MDFTTTEAAERPRRPGPLDRRLGVHPGAPAGAGRARPTVRPRVVEQADRLGHPVQRGGPESLGGGGFGVLEQVAILVALGRQLAAVPYLESIAAGRRRTGRVRIGAAAAGLGRAGSGRRARSSYRRSRRRDGRGPACRPPVLSRRIPPDRHPDPGRLRPRGRRVPGSRRNRFRGPQFSWLPPASRA